MAKNHVERMVVTSYNPFVNKNGKTPKIGFRFRIFNAQATGTGQSQTLRCLTDHTSAISIYVPLAYFVNTEYIYRERLPAWQGFESRQAHQFNIRTAPRCSR